MLDFDRSLMVLAACNPHLERARAEVVDEWAPDEPPPTLAMSSMARGLVANALAVDELGIREVSACIERILETGTEAAKDAVATGFLEAVLAAGDLGDQGAVVLLDALGPRAREYCEAWNKFTGAGGA